MTNESLQSYSLSHMTTGAEEGEGSHNDELSLGGETTLHATRIQTTIEKISIFTTSPDTRFCKVLLFTEACPILVPTIQFTFMFISEDIIREIID